MRAHNTTLATRSIRRFQERDEPTDATRGGLGTVPRNQRPRPAAPGRAPCPDLPPLRLSRRPLPSAPFLLLLQKQQVSLRRAAESGGLAQPPVAAPVLSRAEPSGAALSQAAPCRRERRRAEANCARESRARGRRSERSGGDPGSAAPSRCCRRACSRRRCRAPLRPRRAAGRSPTFPVPSAGERGLDVRARLLPPAPLAQQQSNSGVRGESVPPPRSSRRRRLPQRAAPGPAGAPRRGALLARGAARGAVEVRSARRRGPGQHRPLSETSPQVGMGRGAGAAASLPLLAALALLAGRSPALLGAARAQLSAGGCTFDDGPGPCDYHQDLYDDFDWVHVSAQEPHYLPPEMPQGSYMVVISSDHDPGEKTRLQLPTMKENDTHCIDFSYLLYSKNGGNPGTLNILVRVNKGPLANPIWNVTGSTGKDWLRAELAVSTFWPNEYQVIFEAEVSDGRNGYIAIDDIQVLSYPCDKSPHFLRLGDVEVNAGQNATFQCIATGRDAVNNKLWLQRRNGEDIPVAQTKNINHRRFAATFKLQEVTKTDQDLYRCVTQSERGSGVSNFAQLIVREPPRPIAPPQLLGVGPTYLLIQLNANSIIGDGPIILKEVEYRMTSGTWTETHAVNAPTYKLWHLDPDTEYEIRVLLTRPGEGGTGQPGPPLITRTKCAEPMRTPKTLKIAEIQARHIAVDWESLGYNITRCHTFNVTICYHYFCGHNESKADCLDMDPKAPQHVVDRLPPYTNVSLKMILTNPEGRKESEETIIQTDEDVPGPIPAKSVKGTPFEDKIFLNWKEPVDPNGIITQYEVSYSSIQSFDPAVPVAGPPQTVSKLWNSTHHVFSHLHPGTTYQFFIRASTIKGFGPATTINVTTNISAPTLPDYEGVDASLNETATTITVLLRPAQAKGAPISAYQIVVEELHPHRTKRETGAMECYQIPVTYQTALSGGSPYYFAAQLPPGNLPEPAPFTVGDNRTYQGFWNPPLAPRKGYNIYFQAMSSVEKETKTQCVRIATKAATEEPEVIPDPAKQTDRVVKIAGISAGILVFILLLLVVILIVKKRYITWRRNVCIRNIRRSYYSYSYYLKLAKKRKDAMGTTRQEMTHMVNAMDRSYADQSTLHAEDPLSITFMDSHNFSPRLPNDPLVPTAVLGEDPNENHSATAESSRLLDVPRYLCEGTESPYQTGQLHPAIRVADLLQHINLMKTSDSYGFKEEYESFFEGQSASWDVAKKDQNRTKNRYGNIIAYDHSRVILQPVEDDPSSDYINANYIDIWLYRDGYQRPSHYIATQGPVHETVYDFWRMIWQEQSACVVMVTNLVEVGRVKCYKYWPDDTEVYGDFKVTCVEVEPLAEYVVRTFTLGRRGYNEIREVKQFHFTGWPDHGVPYNATGLLSFIRRVKLSNPPSAGPIVVHCSAGAGRTGCYIVIDIMLDMAEREGVVDIYNCVKALRSRRINMVQTEEQYIFIHDAILEACLCGETAIPVCEFKAAYFDMIRIDSQTNSSHLKDEFQTLNSVTPRLQAEDCSIACLPRNHDKNRFMDMLPPDRCLPFLITIDGESSNYINAALMDSYRQPAAFIVTQHPLPNTVKDFWRLVYDYGCTSLVMLNEVDLAQGCPQYWPEEGILRYGPIQVECMSCSMDCDVINRIFRICNLTRPQEGYLMVQQFQYLGWASHRDVPASKRSFLKLILQVEKWQEECEEGEGRTIIHCLNGGGRSGMFCAIGIVVEMVKRQNVVDVFHAVKTLRNSKPNMVETPEQYRFCYDVALEYLESS
ncbi:receptor-type tyrosine-protein phosphatase kappa isoform X2 [Agelaius tricolor]|uniref:receptor-type tyrosine-protein phosphatase kappa isoform X2 n=1 Tax=Agelaius tricolor TaxID=9191 RepID=UPI0039F18FBF